MPLVACKRHKQGNWWYTSMAAPISKRGACALSLCRWYTSFMPQAFQPCFPTCRKSVLGSWLRMGPDLYGPLSACPKLTIMNLNAEFVLATSRVVEMCKSLPHLRLWLWLFFYAWWWCILWQFSNLELELAAYNANWMIGTVHLISVSHLVVHREWRRWGDGSWNEICLDSWSWRHNIARHVQLLEKYERVCILKERTTKQTRQNAVAHSPAVVHIWRNDPLPPKLQNCMTISYAYLNV